MLDEIYPKNRKISVVGSEMEVVKVGVIFESLYPVFYPAVVSEEVLVVVLVVVPVLR